MPINKPSHIHVRLEDELKAAIVQIKLEEKRTESQVVCILLREALEARA